MITSKGFLIHSQSLGPALFLNQHLVVVNVYSFFEIFNPICWVHLDVLFQATYQAVGYMFRKIARQEWESRRVTASYRRLRHKMYVGNPEKKLNIYSLKLGIKD